MIKKLGENELWELKQLVSRYFHNYIGYYYQTSLVAWVYNREWLFLYLLFRIFYSSGALNIRDHPLFDSESGSGILTFEETDEQMDVELNEDEPAFLTGQTAFQQSYSPIKGKVAIHVFY